MNSVSPLNRKASLWAVGLMLFALFFGAGNLIFPAYLGQQAGESWFSAMTGFLLTGAGLPLLGVIAIGYSGSRDVQALASRVAPWYGVAFAVALYLSIGPLFAMPRTATVSFEIAVAPFLNESQKTVGLAAFSVAFFGVAYWLSMSPGKLVDRIGKILTPVLLLTIAVLVGYAALNPMGVPAAAQGDFALRPFIKGILEGYGTMDALASLVFSIIVIDAVRAMGVDNRSDLLRTTAVSGIVARILSGFGVPLHRLYGRDKRVRLGTSGKRRGSVVENGKFLLRRPRKHPLGRHRPARLLEYRRRTDYIMFRIFQPPVSRHSLQNIRRHQYGRVYGVGEQRPVLHPDLLHPHADAAVPADHRHHPADLPAQTVRRQPHRLFLHHDGNAGSRFARCL